MGKPRYFALNTLSAFVQKVLSLRTKYKGNFELISSKKSTPKLCNDGMKAK